MRVNVSTKVEDNVKTSLDVVINKQNINVESTGLVIGGVKNDHARLVNLDFEHSGHIGFASENQLKILQNSVVPRRLNIFENVDKTIDRNKQFIYIDENHTNSKKISIKELNSYILRNGDSVPNDMQVDVRHAPAPPELPSKEELIYKISSKSSKNCSDSWRYLLNMGYAYQFNDNRMQAQLKEIQQAIHFQYGRICRLLDLTTIHEINHSKRYGFEHIFLLLDEMNRLHLTPFIELGELS